MMDTRSWWGTAQMRTSHRDFGSEGSKYLREALSKVTWGEAESTHTHTTPPAMALSSKCQLSISSWSSVKENADVQAPSLPTIHFPAWEQPGKSVRLTIPKGKVVTFSPVQKWNEKSDIHNCLWQPPWLETQRSSFSLRVLRAEG